MSSTISPTRRAGTSGSRSPQFVHLPTSGAVHAITRTRLTASLDFGRRENHVLWFRSGEDERRLAAVEGERLLEPLQGDAEGDELLERARERHARGVERLDAGEPVLAIRVHAAEEDAGFDH